MILISVQISVYYYPHINELDVQNCQLSIKVHFLECYSKARVIHSIIFSLIVSVFEYTTFFKYPTKRNLNLTSLEI